MIDPAQPDFANTPVAPQRPPFGYAPGDAGARPALSIVTPFYNTGAIFRETAQSVLQQSLQQFEWLIVNDGSTDPESLAMLGAYRQCDPRVRVIDHPANRGLSAARNTGYAAAQTGFVLQLDSDDLLEPTAAEKWLWYLASHPEHGFVKGYSVVFAARERLLTNTFALGAQFLTGNCVNPTALVRRAVHQAVAGYDEQIRDGLEDWEFWLRCANGGYWGGAVAEYLEWKRRRPDPSDRWANLRSKERNQAMHRLVRQRYPRLWEKDGFPLIVPQPQSPYAEIPSDLPCANLLHKPGPRLLLIARCLTMGGGSKFNLDVVEQLSRRGWQISIAVTDPEEQPWLAQFARHTPDIFVLPNIVRLADYPRFLRYLAQSRQVDAILLTGSEIAYQLTPYLRAYLPGVPLVDYCHYVNEETNNGGFPRLSLLYADMLQGTGVSSHQLKDWLVQRGKPPEQVIVQYTNIDAGVWRPDPATRARVRRELAVSATTPVVVFTGRIIPQKQPRVLAQTALRLARQKRDFVLLVAGRGQDLPWLKRFVARHRLHKTVRLLGALSQERVREILAAGDIFFLPSHNEGVSLALFEAMACGLAIVAADVGGQREVVTPECGVLVAHGSEDEDIERYTQALANLLAQPERWTVLGAAARARVQAHFRLEQMADGMIDVFVKRQARCSDTAAQPNVALGQVCAAVAVQRMRLVNEARPVQPALVQYRGPAAAVPGLPRSRAGYRQPVAEAGAGWRSTVRRAGLWLRHPPSHWARRVRIVKNLFPRTLKGAVKQALRIP